MKKWYFVILSLLFIMLMNSSYVQASEKLPGNIYVVMAGDTFLSVAAKFNISEDELKRTNGLISTSLQAGQKLFVPFVYEVSPGDTLEKIAVTYHSTVPHIKVMNGLTSDSIHVGQMLKIAPKILNMQGQYILMTREDFKHWLFNNRFHRKITLIQEHHTWLPSYKQFNGRNHFAVVKGMETFHVNYRKWKNIAQNITTFPDGLIAVSRPFDLAPEGSIGALANTNGLAIENVGNFDLGNDVMTAEQKETIVYVAAVLSIKFGLTPSIDSITYHHWWDLVTGERILDNSKNHITKTCPGTGFFGGNTTTSATKYFYPLVSRKMQEILATIN